MLKVRKATPEDAEEVGRIHYETWMETYTGLIAESYLETLSAEKSAEMARKNQEGLLVACFDGEIVGFASHAPARDGDVAAAGEVRAVYVHPRHQEKGVGKRLVRVCLERMRHHERILVWILAKNDKAIRFYRDQGFVADGVKKKEKLAKNVYIEKIRMVREK